MITHPAALPTGVALFLATLLMALGCTAQLDDGVDPEWVEEDVAGATAAVRKSNLKSILRCQPNFSDTVCLADCRVTERFENGNVRCTCSQYICDGYGECTKNGWEITQTVDPDEESCGDSKNLQADRSFGVVDVRVAPVSPIRQTYPSSGSIYERSF